MKNILIYQNQKSKKENKKCKYFLRRALISSFQVVDSMPVLPSDSPLGGSTIKKAMRMTATAPSTGVTRRPHCQALAMRAVSLPTMYPSPL